MPEINLKINRAMNYNEIGKTGMRVSNLSFGASSLGGVFHDIREAEGIKAVYTAVENGMNFIDVSPYYGHYKAETVLGKALKEIPRDKCVSVGLIHNTKEIGYVFYGNILCNQN
jgi:aryl-alcohol dehydrogenase-like predicted oxidoreductase